jgi:hypothetical protein
MALTCCLIYQKRSLDSALGSLSQIQFRTDGAMNDTNEQKFNLCDSRKKGREITIAAIGRVSTKNEFTCT